MNVCLETSVYNTGYLGYTYIEMNVVFISLCFNNLCSTNNRGMLVSRVDLARLCRAKSALRQKQILAHCRSLVSQRYPASDDTVGTKQVSRLQAINLFLIEEYQNRLAASDLDNTLFTGCLDGHIADWCALGERLPSPCRQRAIAGVDGRCSHSLHVQFVFIRSLGDGR